MIAKSCTTRSYDWDLHLPSLLFAYCSVVQETTRQSYFMGRDPRVPTSTVLSQRWGIYTVDPEDYRSELVIRLAEAWKLAHDNIDQAQLVQKRKYDEKRQEVDLKKVERVMVYMPNQEQEKE